MQFISTEHLAVGKPKALLIFCRDSGYTNEHGLSELRNGAEVPRGFFAFSHKIDLWPYGESWAGSSFTALSATVITVLKPLKPCWYRAVLVRI